MIRKAINSDFSIITEYYREFDENNVELFETDPFSHLYVYEYEKNIVGFVNYSIIYDRAEINYIYINEKYRGKHFASELMEFLIVDAIDNGCLNITLEVSEKNEPGIKLYKKFGFIEKATRKNYYKDSDAILMMKELVKDE